MSPYRAAVFVLTFVFALAAQAAAPMAKTAPPGFFRIMLGDFEVTALSDGTADLPVDQLLTGTTKAKVDKGLAKVFLKSPLQTSVNAFLVNTGTKLVLIDTGSGTLFGPTVGKLMANLKASGYEPGQVDEVYITHMHPDHVGGLSTDGKMNFPNAVVRADKHDADYWLSAETLAKADEGSKGFVQGAQAMLAPYVQAGKFKPFEGTTELVPGITGVATHGHTPGHAIYVVESKGQKLVLWGDLMHLAAVQRKKAFADAAKGGYWVGAAHLAFPGLGHLVADGKAYRFIPANYTVIRTAQ